MKDVRFAFSSIVLNLLDVVFEVPLSLMRLMNIQNPARLHLCVTIGIFLFYLSYSISFFVHFTFNHLFRNEFLLMMGTRKQPTALISQEEVPAIRNLYETENKELVGDLSNNQKQTTSFTR
jgi:hypothetical protein